MDDNKFFMIITLTVTMSILVFLSVFVISIALFYSNKDARIAEMVKNGADPMIAACSVDKQSISTCELYFATKK